MQALKEEGYLKASIAGIVGVFCEKAQNSFLL
jgi:hypothetical protein